MSTNNTRRVRSTPEANIYRPPAARLSQEPPQDLEAKPSTRQRRPDLQVYVPRPRRFASDTTTCSSPPTQPPVLPPPSSQQQEPKSTRHRNCSPNIVTPRKKSQKTPEKTTFLSNTTTSSGESDIFELDNQDSNSKYLPYFVKTEILLPSSDNTIVENNISSENIVENNDSCTPYFVKSNEIYSSTINSFKTLENDDNISEYLENPTSNIETEFTKFLQNGHKSKNSNENVSNIDKKFTEEDKKLEVNDKIAEYLESNNTEVNDKISEYLESNNKSDGNKLTEFLNKSSLEKTSHKENDTTFNDKETDNSSSSMLIKPTKHIQNKKVVTPILKISSETKLEPLFDLEKLVQDDNKKVKRTKSTGNKTSENCKTNQESPMSKKSNLNIEECSWDMLFDENGDCLEPSIMDELTKQVGRVKVERPSSNYGAYENAREAILAETDYPHVLEVYSFPVEFKTQDLMAVLTPLAGRAGLELKWVDDTHALAVFSNSQIAAEVLSYNHPMLKTRPLSQACPESKQKARRSSDFLQPYRARPETCTAMAKRLVSSALGVRITTSKEEREKERSLLREAREKKRLAAKQSEEAWEGKITSK